MIKIFKLFETYKRKPKKGDYVICSYKEDKKVDVFISNNIGKIINDDYDNAWYNYLVEYDNPTIHMKINYTPVNTNSMIFSEEEIVHWSKNKKELEMILTTNKFNI